MKKSIFLLLSILLITFTTCRKEDPQPPFYEVVPVVEVSNAFFNDIYAVRLNITLEVNGVPTTQLWDIPFKGVRYGCTLLKWTGKAVEYQAPTDLKLTVKVLYDVTGDGGFVLLENFSDGYLPKEATWIRVYFEVRDRNNPSDRFVGIEQYSNPLVGEYQPPTVIWTVSSDFNFIPTNQVSPNTDARIAKPIECEECVWREVF